MSISINGRVSSTATGGWRGFTDTVDLAVRDGVDLTALGVTDLGGLDPPGLVGLEPLGLAVICFWSFSTNYCKLKLFSRVNFFIRGYETGIRQKMRVF